MSDNPFASPTQEIKPPAPTSEEGNGFVKQVPVVGILMVVMGALELLMGAGLVVLGLFMPGFIAVIEKDPSMDATELAFMKDVLTWTYAAMGGGGVVGGLLRLAGGIQTMRFKSHVLGLVGNFGGLLSLTTCYCSIFSVGVSVYGLIVLFQPSVRDEFRRRA